MTDNRPINVRDRFETLDGRDRGRVVEVIETLGLKPSTARRIDALAAKHGAAGLDFAKIEKLRERGNFFLVRTEAHPKNPQALGNVSRVSERTLRRRYKRNSR